MPARTVLQQADITRALTRISHEILESNRGTSGLILLGIPTRGVVLARRIGEIIGRMEPGTGELVGSLDVTMYRDDLSHHPTRTPAPTSVPASIDDALLRELAGTVDQLRSPTRSLLRAVGELRTARRGGVQAVRELVRASGQLGGAVGRLARTARELVGA